MRLSKVPKRFRHIRFFAVAQNDRETRCVQGKCLPKRRMRVLCAHVRKLERRHCQTKKETTRR